MNNFGFCLEYRLGITQDIVEARRYYFMAKKLNHSEADVNHRRCCRLLGEWEIPTRSSTQENLTEQSFHSYQSTIPEPDRFLPTIQALRSVADLRISLNPRKAMQILSHAWAASSGEIKFHETLDGVRQAIKTIAMDANLESDIATLAEFAHPCVLRTEGFIRMGDSANVAVVTELMENGALPDNLSRKRRGKLPRLRSPTKISKIVAGVVLGMRFMQSYGCVHGHLKPANILLDRQWRVRIADFGTSHFRHDERLLLESFYPDDMRYLPPERLEGEAPSKGNDVYAFGLILYELVVGNPLFPPDLKPQTE
jgi:serine/threonine protein kinase